MLCVEYLLMHGADPQFVTRDPAQLSILHIAVRTGNPRIVSLLVKAGALVNQRDARGRTPLHVAVTEAPIQFRKEIAKILLANLASPDIADSAGATPHALAKGELEAALERQESVSYIVGSEEDAAQAPNPGANGPAAGAGGGYLGNSNHDAPRGTSRYAGPALVVSHAPPLPHDKNHQYHQPGGSSGANPYPDTIFPESRSTSFLSLSSMLSGGSLDPSGSDNPHHHGRSLYAAAGGAAGGSSSSPRPRSKERQEALREAEASLRLAGQARIGVLRAIVSIVEPNTAKSLYRNVASKDRDGVISLLKKGMDPNRLSYGSSALHLATELGTVETMQVLVHYGADINSLDKEGMTPLHIAAKARQSAALRYLADCGAQINLTSYRG